MSSYSSFRTTKKKSTSTYIRIYLCKKKKKDFPIEIAVVFFDTPLYINLPNFKHVHKTVAAKKKRKKKKKRHSI